MVRVWHDPKFMINPILCTCDPKDEEKEGEGGGRRRVKHRQPCADCLEVAMLGPQASWPKPKRAENVDTRCCSLGSCFSGKKGKTETPELTELSPKLSKKNPVYMNAFTLNSLRLSLPLGGRRTLNGN